MRDVSGVWLKIRTLKYHFLGDFDKEMLKLHNGGKLLNTLHINRLIENSIDKIIAFMRSDFLFVFNFHPVTSYTDYGIPVTGKFKVILDTDNPAFGGFDRIDRSIIYRAIKKSDKININEPYRLYLYLPSIFAIVLKKEPIRKVTDI